MSRWMTTLLGIPLKYKVLIGTIAVFVAAGGTVIAWTAGRPPLGGRGTPPQAAGPTGEAGVRTGSPAPGASGSSPAVPPPAGPGPTGTGRPPATDAKPGSANTGVPAGTKLKRHAGNLDVTTDGAVIDALDITEGINVKANNVTIRRVRARCTSGGGGGCVTILPGHTGTRIEDTEVGGGVNGTTYTGTDIGIVVGANNDAPAHTTRITRVNIHHTVDGLRSDGSVTVANSYVHHLDPGAGQHGDGSQSTGWSNMIFRHNTIVGGLTSAIYLNREGANPAISNVVVDDNWLEGAPEGKTAFPLYVNSGTSNVTVTNNRFNRSGYQPALDRPGTAIVTWANNTWADTGAVITAPAKGG